MRLATLKSSIVMSFFLLIAAYTATGKIIYVDSDAQGPVYDGSSWATAFAYLQEALTVASSGDEIRVAQGVYRPHEPAPEPPPTPVPSPPQPPDRTATFQLKNGVVIKGGFAGFGEPDPDARDIEAYETILSGDLKGNDVNVNDPRDLVDDPCRADNSYHVVTGSGTNNTALLDGFTITAGNATGKSGGGMYNSQGSPKLTNCTFINNAADEAGGMYNEAGNPTLINCLFNGNCAVDEDGGGIYNYNSNPKLTNCTFSGNLADEDGGGMFNYNSSPTLTSCTVRGNLARSGGGIFNGSSDVTLTDCDFTENLAHLGGGIYNEDSEPTFTKCTFSGNFAFIEGGGMNNWLSFPRLANCVFLNNSAGIKGGGIQSLNSHIMQMVNCKFSGNRTECDGGAIYIEGGSAPLDNCTLAGNLAGQKGGGIVLLGTSIGVINCILWGNSDSGGEGESAQIYFENTQPVINYSCIQDWTGDLGGTGMISDDPCFVEPGYWDSNGTPEYANDDFWIDGDYHLLDGSPCIDAGDNAVVPATVTTDLDGMPRIKNGIVDMGAYESRAVFFVDIDATGANDGSSWADAFKRIEDAIAAALEGDEIRVAQGTYRPTPPAPYQAVNPTPADSAIEVGTTADLSWIAGSGAMSHDVYFGTASPGLFQGNQVSTNFDPGTMELGTTYYWRIDEVSTWGTTTGEVWSFTTIVGPPPSVPSVVAAGSASETSIMEHCRLATFVLKNGVIMKGGYAGFGEPDPDARDIDSYQTILSGDMNGDDVEVNDPCDLLTDPSRADNCYHVVTSSESDYYGPNTILDGFTITGGNADGQYPDWELEAGGGMYNRYSSPTVINCTFTENSARSGGGMDNEAGWPYLINCTFSRNFSNWGGGLANGAPPTLIDCTFIGNVSSNKGGAMACGDASPPMNNCSFIDNRALIGGAIYGGDCFPKPTNCTFTGNSAEKGGVVYNNDSSVILTNCTLSGNWATEGGVIYDDEGGSTLINCILTANAAVSGGVIYSGDDSSARLTNCVLSGNTAESGGVMYICDESNVKLIHCTLSANSADNGNALACDSYEHQYPSTVEVSNSILWDGGSEIWNNDGSEITITYSDVQGGWPGEGNIDAEPLFVEPGYWDASDIWIEGDYRLRAVSPCIDAGTDVGIYEDIVGNVRPFDFPGVDNNEELADVDMGAYEAIATIQGELLVQPNKVNLNARSKKIFAVIRLPEPIVGNDIDMSEPLVLYPGGIEADEQKLFPSDETEEDGVRIRAVFDRAELLAAMPEHDDVEVTVIGRFVSGEYFYGSNNIRIEGSPR